MVGDPVEQFIRLAQLDREFSQQTAQLQEVTLTIEALRHKELQLQNQLQHAQEHLLKMRTRSMELEHELLAVRQIQAHKQQQLDQTNSAKQYDSLQKELQQIDQNIASLENETIAQWHEIETAESSLSTLEVTTAEGMQSLEQEVAAAQETARVFEQQISSIKNERHQLLQSLPEEWISEYERARHSYAQPVVPLINNACSGCFRLFTESELATLRRKRLMRCPECFRFIYLVSAS